MAVIAVSNHWDGSSGRHERAHGSSFNAKFRVWTNNALDQSQVVLDWVRANLVVPGSRYLYANDNGVQVASIARARNYTADRELGTNTVWIVTVEYVNDASPDEGETIAGVPTENPLLFRPLIKWGTVRYTEPCEKVRYRGGFHGQADALRGPLGRIGDATNSAGMKFQPGLERDANHSYLTVIQNVATFDADQAEQACNTINAFALNLNRFGFSLTIPKWCGKIAEVEMEERRQAGVDFMAVQTLIEINRATWNDDVADLGVHARARAGDPNGRGGIISASELIAGVPQVRHLVDQDEMPISDPVPLDGDGQPADPGTDQVFVTYQKHEESIFLTLPWLAIAFT